jgi:tetratricopeptide (TPR) repeat protein
MEITLQATPTIDDDLNFVQFLDRFSQPSDGLPVEILDTLVPRIRSLVFRGYMTGWFEATGGFDKTIVSALTEWVEFRNKRPGHGVLDAPTTAIWAQRTGDLIQRILEADRDALPRSEGNRLVMQVGDIAVPITTPLVIDGSAIVIGKIAPRSGVWKVQGQLLSWLDARDTTIDLGPSNIFASNRQVTEKFRWSEVPCEKGSTLVLNNVPVRQTSTFVGRKKELDKLAEWLKDIADSRACLVFGDGGFGKTTLVLEFFNNLLEDGIGGDTPIPSVISFWTAKKTKWTEEGLVHFKGISDAMEDSVRELMYCLDPVLGKEWYKIDGRALIEKVATKFAEEGFSRDDVLLIVDNTETLATSTSDSEALADFIARVAKRIGRVVITSRRRELLAAEPIPVSQLSESEAVQLMQELGKEYGALAINMAGYSTLRKACQQLMFKPLLIDTLVRYLARSSSGIQTGLDQILRKTNDELLEFLYEDAWARMNALVQEVFMVLVSLASPLDGRCVGDVCTKIGVQHAEFQASLDETYFATIVDHGDSYDLEIVELAKRFFLQKKRRVSTGEAERLDSIAFVVDKQATERYEIVRNYRSDRVADAFRSEYAKAAKIAVIKKDFEAAKASFDLAILEEPLNAALQDRYASFLLRTLGKPDVALQYAQRATELDSHSGDAWLTLGLIRYQLNDLANGDSAMEKAMEYGKAESLCLLRKAIARYHSARREPYRKRSLVHLKEAESLVKRSMASASPEDFYYRKNLHEAEKYSSLIRGLILMINRREVATENAPKGF